MMQVTLSSAEHPEYGQATISFPIPREEYDRCIESLETLKAGSALGQDCRVDKLTSYYGILEQLEGQSVNVDELDYLAKRLDSFCTGEDAQFQAMAHKLDLTDIKDFIDLTFCCQQATVITSFSDLEQIGKDHMLTLNGGGMPMDQYQAVDGRKEALKLTQSGSGTVTPYGVVYDNGMVLEQCYNGHQFPAYLHECPVMMLEITPKQGLAEGNNPEYLYLPAAAHQIERTLQRVGIDTLSNAQVRLELDEFPDITAGSLDLEHLSGDDLPGLNRLCQAIQPMTEADTEKLNAVVLMADTSDVFSLCQLAENLDQFDFIPGIQTAEEYGKYMIRESGQFEYDENLDDVYDYRRYGEQRIQNEGGQFNECGYVAYHGTLSLDELMREDPAEQYQRDQGQKIAARIADLSSTIPNLSRYINTADIDGSDYDKLTHLADRLEGLTEQERWTFSGALDAESINGLDDILHVAEHLDGYEFFEGVTSDRELGGYVVEHDLLDVEIPEAVRPYLDYTAIGAGYYSDHGGAYTMNGYVQRLEEGQMLTEGEVQQDGGFGMGQQMM